MPPTSLAGHVCQYSPPCFTPPTDRLHCTLPQVMTAHGVDLPQTAGGGAGTSGAAGGGAPPPPPPSPPPLTIVWGQSPAVPADAPSRVQPAAAPQAVAPAVERDTQVGGGEQRGRSYIIGLEP